MTNREEMPAALGTGYQPPCGSFRKQNTLANQEWAGDEIDHYEGDHYACTTLEP